MRGMSKKGALACQVSLGLFAGLLGIASTAHGMPVHDGGGTNHNGVRAGSVTGTEISPGSTTMNIDSTTANNVIGWKDFSVKNGESVVFDSGAKTNNYLNVVTGKVTSRIDGSITGGNNVYIANTNGVVFGATASVNVGNLYVTTRAVDVDAIGTAVAGGATLASQESSIINTTAAAAPNTAKAEVVSLVDGAGHSVAANKIVIEGQSVRILNSANIAATTDVQISVSAAQKEFQQEGPVGIMTTVGTRNKGYIHVGSTTGGAAPASYHGNLAVEGFKLVSTPQELEDMKNDLAGNYMLKNDIDLSSTAHTPIGKGATPFAGKFDGMFHEVKNMTLGAGSAADHAGLFGNINGAVVMNVGIKNANLSSLNYGGAVVGKAENSHIFNVYNESTSMIGSAGANATNAGGVVGWLKSSTLDTAYNTSSVGKAAGGLVGNLQSSQLMDAYNTGAVQFNTGTSVNESWGAYGSGTGGTSLVRNVYLNNNGAAAAGSSDLSMSVQESYQITGTDHKNTLLKGTGEKDGLSATSYSTWDIAADGGENKTWRIFDGHSLPLLTAFMQGAVQAEYAYADFQQTGHAHSDNTASTYTVQAADKQTDGSYVTRAGKESNDGKSISRVYNADYLKIAKKNGDGSYSAITNVNDADLKLYGADDRSLVHLSQGTAGGGRRNAGSNAAYDGVNDKGGREAMLYGGQHGYDIAGANVTIGKRKVIGSVNNMGKIEREYDGTADASSQFADAIKTGNVSLRTDGLVDGDGAAVNFTNNNAVTFRQAWTATSAKSPDVGYDKPVFVDGSLVQFTGGEENYEFDASAINALNLKGNITQRKITATLNPATGINKVYDGDTDVKGAAYIPTATNNVLTFANTVGSDNVGNLLDDTDIKGKYRTGDSNANPGTETKNAGTHGVAYSGIKLKGANKHNYKLVDGSGNILYREAVTGETTTDAVVTSGTIWGKGEIKRRNISADTFLWNGIGMVSKVYDGTTEFDNAANKTITAKKKGDPGVNLNEGLIAGDAAKVKFEIAGKGEFRKSDGTTPTANVAEAAKAAYKLTATNTTSEDVLSNYKIGGVEAASGGKYDVTSAGKITPRVIDVQLLKATGIDKTYDGTVDAVEGDDGHKYLTMGKTWVGYAGTGRLVGDTNDSGIGTDGAKVKVTATYRQHGTTTNDKNVVRAADKSVIENGKDVYYTFKLEGGNAATNYTFNSDGTTPQAEKYATGMGTITPKKLTLASPGNVTRDYDGTSKVYKSQLPASYTTVTDGVESGDTVHLDFGTSDEVGTYYTDNTMATEAQDANVTTGGAHISGTPQNYTVKYTFTPTLDNGNYEVDGTTPPTGEGKIRQLGLTDANFEMDFGDREKVFDGQDTANIGNDLTSLKVKKGSETIFDFTKKPNSYEITGKYDNTHANLGRGAFGSRNLLTGKNAYNVTYKVKFQGQNLKNYDFNTLSSSTLYTWDPSEQTVSRTKQVGYIRQKEVVASIVNPTVSKVYNGFKNVLDDKGEKIGPGAGINLNGLAQHSGGTYGSNRSDGEYDNKNVQSTLHDVTYRLKVEGSDGYGSYADDYYFVEQAGGASVTQLVGKGEIKARPIDVEFFDANRQYDGTTAVDKGASDWGYRLKARDKDSQKDKDLVKQLLGNKPADSANDMPAGDNLQGNSAKFDATQITGNYVDEHGTPQSDVGIYEGRVKYEGIKNALLDGNYTIENIKMGRGEIKKRTFNAGDIDLAIGTATKVYDGTTLVKKDGDESRKQEYIQHFKMNLGGAVGWKDYALGTDYSLEGAAYDDPNVAANTAPQPGKIQYKFSLKDSPLLKNYDFTNLPAGYALAGDTLTRTIENNTITKRPVYAHVVNSNVTKTYNAKKNVIDENGAALLGDQLVTFDNVKNGVAQAEAGLIKKDNLGNATTASYTEKKVGDQNRTIDYTLALSGNSALFNNYELQDENGHATLTTHTNTINRRALRLKADAVTKVYDANTTVKVGGTPSATGEGLHFFDGNDKQWDDRPTPVQDDVKIDTVAPNVYAREYKSKNATRTEEDKKNNVNYTGIKLTGTDAANYYLADSEKNALQGNDTAGYTMTGDGEITPFQVTRANFNLKLKDLDKRYDGNVFVKDGTPENPAGWKTSHIDKSEITDGSNNHLYDLDVDKVASATYRNTADTADDKNVDTGKKVLFKLKFTKDTLNNFDFDALKTADANGSRMIDGVYHAYGTGKITPKDLRVKLDGYARKAYDGTSDVKDVEDRLSLVKEDIVSGDEVSLGSSKGYYQQGTAAGSPKMANANIAPTDANANHYDVSYTVQSDGADRNNYRFINAADGTVVDHNGGSIYAKGDIERRKLYASTKPVEKTYNADTDVRINNAPANANDLVEFHDAEGKKDAVFASGSYGTNATTAAYVANPAVPSAAAADASDTANKWVKYTLKIDGQDAGGTDYANNYVVYDEKQQNTVVYDAAAGTNDGLTTTANKINRAPLTVTADYATKQYDGGKKVKNPSPNTLLNITGGWKGTDGGDLNRTAYTATYLDENVNKEGVDYGNIQIDPTGTTKVSNYTLSYNGKEVARNGETYSLHGEGEITKRILTGDDLKAGFTTTSIKKSYDGTADVKNPVQYVNYMRTSYTKDDGTPLDLRADGYTVERADYVASANTAAKDVGKRKDVKFQFALSDSNFDYSHLAGATLGADGVYRFSQNYDRDASGFGRGEIFGRRVALTLHLVQKVYDGTKDVKDGYYTKDEKTGKLVENNPNLDWKKVITLDGDGKIGGDENSGFAHGEKLDFNATGEYTDANANRDPHYTGAIQPANKDVTYKMRLKDDAANKNYTFQIRVVDAAGNTLKTAASETTTFIDPADSTVHDGHKFDGLGNIWQKQLTLTKTNDWGKNYDGNANVTDAVKKGLQFDGVAQRDTGFFNFSDPANARANTFAGKLSGRYGDRAVEGSFLDTPGNTAVYKHVKRPQGNLNGTPEARDVELTGVKDALASLQTPGSVANNYFYDGDNTVYGMGVIKPLTLDLKKTWLKNGADFSKTYDGDPLAKINGDVLDPESKKDPQDKLKNKQAFHDKLKLSVDLGTGESPIELDYTLYGDEKGDYEGYRPHYENLSGGHAHHGQSDANVKNSADPMDTLNKDIVYKLKRINGDKAWANQAEGARYKDWELSENPSGADLRLSDAATDTHTDNTSGLRAVITPRKVDVQADAYSKIYDGTTSLTAPSLSAGELAKKQQELRSKLHVTDEEAAKMLKNDGIDFTVDTDSSQFLDKTSRLADANVARDAVGNVLKDAAGNIPADGKLVEYRLRKTGDAVKQGNYELPSAALPSGVQTDTVLGTGSITPRIVRTEFDPASTAAPDKIYDGTQYAVKDGNIHSRTFKLVDAVGDEGVVAADAGDVKLNQTHNVGKFASPNVKKDKNGVQAQDVIYHEGIKLTNGRNKAGNYKLVSDNLKDTAKITPRPITATLKNEPIVKEYDGTKEVQDLRRYIGKDANGKDAFETKTAFREGNINFVDKNPKVTGISAPAQPTWEAADEEKGMKLTNALYDNENVGKNRRVTYDIAMNSDNYMLVDAAGSSLMSGDRTAQIVSNRGEIDRRKVFFGVRKDANKIYDGTTNVRKPLDDLKLTYNGTGAAPNEENGIIEKDRQTLNDALRVRGVYTDDANAADSDDDSPKTHDVRYSFEKDEARDPVLSNYEIATAKGDNTIYGKGIIRRRTLDVLPDWQATYASKGGMNFTGRIADGTNEDSPLTNEVKRDLQKFNSGVFSYGPEGSVDYRTPNPHDILGWYMKDGVKTLASGNYTYVDDQAVSHGSNYTLRSVPSKLFVAPRVDSVVPERTIRPDSKVYERAAFDESNAFGKSKDLNAALAYTGEGVNIGGTKSQQGTSANASAAGIRQQGTGTNIGSSAGIGGAAGVNGKVQGATGAANEAARVAGAQPGANVKPQGAQSGAAVKPQGTTGDNAALAGGTAGQGGYYSPSAQPGASVKPQGAQSGAAVKPQGTTGGNAALAGGTAGQGGYYSPSAQPGAGVKPQGAQSGVAVRPQGAASAVGSASSTVGAESVVDRGLAAAAGMSVGSSSDARTGASSSRRSADYSSGAGSYADGSSRAADRGLANALGKGVGSAGYYSGKGYSHTNDDEEEEIKKKTKASA